MDFQSQLESSLEVSHTNTYHSPQDSIQSKQAKTPPKGQRVHRCEHFDCNKVFTRAEHRRRHELTHSVKTDYTCAHEGCTRKYKRAASLMRHQRQHINEIPVNSNSPPAMKLETLFLPSMHQIDGLSPQPPRTSSMSIQKAEDISGPGFDFENSLGVFLQEPGYTEDEVDAGVPVSDVLIQATQLRESEDKEYLTSSSLLSQVGLEAIIYQYLHKVLRPDAFKATPDLPNAEQLPANHGSP